MTARLTRAAYEALVAENIVWLQSLPRTLERDHVIMIVQRSPESEYGPAVPDGCAREDLQARVEHWQHAAKHHHACARELEDELEDQHEKRRQAEAQASANLRELAAQRNTLAAAIDDHWLRIAPDPMGGVLPSHAAAKMQAIVDAAELRGARWMYDAFFAAREKLEPQAVCASRRDLE